MELRDQLLGTAEFHGIAQPADELDLDQRVIEIAFGIEQVDLQRHTFVTEGRTRAEIHHAAKSRMSCFHAHRVHAVRRQELSPRPEVEVDGWKPEHPAALLAGGDATPERVSPAESVGRPCEIAMGHRATNSVRTVLPYQSPVASKR